jgi:hypothetical protein
MYIYFFGNKPIHCIDRLAKIIEMNPPENNSPSKNHWENSSFINSPDWQKKTDSPQTVPFARKFNENNSPGKIQPKQITIHSY